MPRVAGVSTSSTLWPIRRSPMPCTVAAWVRSNPIGLFTSVIFTFGVSPAGFFFFALQSSP